MSKGKYDELLRVQGRSRIPSKASRMGCRLHAVKKFVKEYAEGSIFNWQQNNLSDTFDNYEVCHNDSDGEDGCGSIEIDGDDWRKFLKDFEEDNGAKSKLEDYTVEEQLTYFKSVPFCEDDFVRFDWF